MKLIPKPISRVGGRAVLKISAGSPTLLVVAGVVGLGATAVLAARATRSLDPILDEHKKARVEVGYVGNNRAAQKDLALLYMHTGKDLAKLYGPTVFVGATSAVAVLGGHKILRGRQIATMAAYSGLFDQFNLYRKRVAQTIGDDLERDIYEGAHAEWVEDPDHKGEYKLASKFKDNGKPIKGEPYNYLRPWFDETNPNWNRDPKTNYLFLKGVQSHMNNLLEVRGHVFLNDVYDALGIPRVREGAIAGWLRNSEKGDGYVDFGFMTSNDPNTVAFRKGVERVVRLNFNIDPDPIWMLI